MTRMPPTTKPRRRHPNSDKGRRPLMSDPVGVSLDLERSTLAAVEAVAAAEGVSRVTVIRRAVERDPAVAARLVRP